jgi:hypothetical protein
MMFISNFFSNKNNKTYECIICLQDIHNDERKIMAFLCNCKPKIHYECLQLWIKNSNTCPICRKSNEKIQRDNTITIFSAYLGGFLMFIFYISFFRNIYLNIFYNLDHEL